ncbi:DUF5808 domain-containing protein [Cohnella sp. AR92]|uniref:DUF5808 domain-containing protein n=1 Tax=Cohnella sp. AR92 TaxID=648716 RepID=UPI000F8EDBC6|nr:DUF5808 domain-containing protein [Cohnella sp. AR92]RUS47023.1 hypothetical protein ELR57_11505 [Cohnella sp. AR92]
MKQESMILLSSSYLMYALFLSLLVYLGPRALLFGIALPAEASQDKAVREIRRNYALLTGCMAILIGGACFLWIRDQPAGRIVLWSWMTAILVLSLASSFAIWISRSSAQQLKAARGWQVVAQTKRAASLEVGRANGSAWSPWWYSAHVAVMALCICFAIARWEEIPQRLTTFLVDHDSSKSVRTVFLWNFWQALTIALFLGIHRMIGRVRISLDPQDRESSLRKQLKRKRIYSVLAWGASLLMIVFHGLTQAVTLYGWKDDLIFRSGLALWVVLFLALMGVMLYLRIRGLDQLKDFPSQEERHWRWLGSVYVNRDDPALFVPDRYGFLWTVNMANPIGKIIAAAAIVVLAIFLLAFNYLR